MVMPAAGTRIVIPVAVHQYRLRTLICDFVREILQQRLGGRRTARYPRTVGHHMLYPFLLLRSEVGAVAVVVVHDIGRSEQRAPVAWLTLVGIVWERPCVQHRLVGVSVVFRRIAAAVVAGIIRICAAASIFAKGV